MPADATVKGMFLNATVETVKGLGGPSLAEERFFAFRDYPLRRSLELLVEGARHVYADQPPREGLRRLARPGYAVFADSLIGKVVFAAIGRDPAAIYKLAAKAWRHAASVGKLEPQIVDPHTALIRVSELYLTDAVGIAIAEGVLEACGRDGYVAQRMRSPLEGEFLIHWS